MDMNDDEMVLYDYHGELHYVSVGTMMEWYCNPDEGPYRSEYKKLNPGQCTYIEHIREDDYMPTVRFYPKGTSTIVRWDEIQLAPVNTTKEDVLAMHEEANK